MLLLLSFIAKQDEPAFLGEWLAFCPFGAWEAPGEK
jgi:hypothetical protein